MNRKTFILVNLSLFLMLALAVGRVFGANPEHFIPVNPNPKSMDVYGNVKIGGQNVEPGDEVGAFITVDGNDICIGGYKITEDDWLEEENTYKYGFMPVYGDDDTTPEKDGADPEETFTLKIWDKSENKEYVATLLGPDEPLWEDKAQKNINLDVSFGSISGTVNYQGEFTGTIYVGAFDNPEFTGDPVNGTELESPGAYTIPNLPDGTYYVGAFMDMDADEEVDEEEPQGFYDDNEDGTPDPVVLASDATGIDITLTRTDDDTEGPVIGTPTYSTSVTSGQSIDITANISDAATGGSGVSNAILYYGYTPPYNQNNVQGTGPGGNGDGEWTFNIPGQSEDNEGDTLKFYIVAEDNDNDIPDDSAFTTSPTYDISIQDEDTDPPDFSNASVNPASPTDVDTLTFHVDITDPSGVKDNEANNESVYVMWATNPGFSENVGMSDMDEGGSFVSDTPAGPFNPGVTVYWKVYAEDNDNSPSGGWSSVYQVNIADDDTTPPTVGTLQFNPLPPQVTDDVTVTVNVNDASDIWDDGTHPTLYYSWNSGIDPDNPATYEASVDMAVNDGVATGTIPAPGGEGGERTRYAKVRVWDNDYDNDNPNDRLYTDSEEDSFTYADDDTQGPVISDITFNSQVPADQSLTVTANISDATTGNSGVYSATLYYWYHIPYPDDPVVGVGPGDNGDGIWTFTIPPQGTEHGGDTLKFWIVAYDNDFDNNDPGDRAYTVDDNSGNYYSVLIVSPRLDVDPTSLNFGTAETEMTFDITNKGTGELNWNVGDPTYNQGEGWITSINPTSGTTTTETDTVTVTVSREGLPVGVYTAQIPVTSNGGDANVDVRMEVANQPPNQPTALSPTGDDIELTPTLEGSPFSDPNPGDTHSASWWQIWWILGEEEGRFGILDEGEKLVFERKDDSEHLTSIPVPEGVLKYGKNYRWQVKYRDNHGTYSDWSEPPGEFNTIPYGDPDSDDQNANGVPNEEELSQEEWEDYLEEHPEADTGIHVSEDIREDLPVIGVEIDKGEVTRIDSVNPDELPDKPADYNFPYGVFTVRIEGLQDGETVNITYLLPEPLSGIITWYKYDEINGWREYPCELNEAGDRVSITVTDGGDGDADGVANGIIVDPSGPGSSTGGGEEDDGGGGGGGGGGCFISILGIRH